LKKFSTIGVIPPKMFDLIQIFKMRRFTPMGSTT